MRRLTYALKFIRPASTTSAANQIIAAGDCVLTSTPVGVPGEIGSLYQYPTASVETTPSFNPDGSFTEKGTVTFGNPDGNNTLSFSSINFGYLNAYPCPEAPYTSGTVMWQIESGTGFFAGATGAITSNFLVDASNPPVAGELIAYQYGVVYLP